jgi:hypothetical protein
VGISSGMGKGRRAGVAARRGPTLAEDDDPDDGRDCHTDSKREPEASAGAPAAGLRTARGANFVWSEPRSASPRLCHDVSRMGPGIVAR